MTGQDIQWGTLPEWVAALGTVGAFSVALLLLGRQMAALRASEEDRRKRQAFNVGAWWEPIKNGHIYRFHVRNANPTPIYSCLVILRAVYKPVGAAIMSISVPVVAPNDTAIEDRPAAEIHPDDVRGASVELGFTDSDGRHWRRHRDGTLAELSEPMRWC